MSSEEAARALREILDNPIVGDPVEAEITRELAREGLAAIERGETPSPALAARSYRRFADAVRDAEQRRADLQEAAEAGDQDASEMLALLSDDPWWTLRDRTAGARS